MSGEPWLPQSVGDSIAEDAESLAALHDRELTSDLLDALREARFPACMGLLPETDSARLAWSAMAEGITQLPVRPGGREMDELASEYAAIYLTGAYGASPYESVWTDDDHLTCQAAMFELRELYATAGLVVTDWRQRADDHMVLQLLYIAHAARKARSTDDWRALADMLDEHPLHWLPDFAARVAARTGSSFYAGLAVLTAAWLEVLRDLLVKTLGESRPSRQTIVDRLRARRTHPAVEAPLSFMPGAQGPSW
jgi:TorA maturation chaperone TorD